MKKKLQVEYIVFSIYEIESIAGSPVFFLLLHQSRRLFIDFINKLFFTLIKPFEAPEERYMLVLFQSIPLYTKKLVG